jgi:hypothetical protein
MGNFFASNSVTRQEMIDYVNSITPPDPKLSKEYRILSKDYEALKAQNESLLSQNESLKARELQRTSLKSLKINQTSLQSEISEQAIDDVVKKMLADPNTNLGAIPDMIEGPIEKKTLKMLLGAIAKISETSSISLLGHEIKFIIRPLADSK